jgi:predicted phage terminase large subunit-like protein
MTRSRQFFLVNVYRARLDYPALKSGVVALAAKFKAHRVLIEDAGAGTSLVQELQRQVSGVIGVKPERDKVSRMAVASAKIEAGQVLLPRRAPWLADFEAELFAFPAARHDDQCDSVSQALIDQNVKPPMIISDELIQRLRERERRRLRNRLGYTGWSPFPP